MNESFSKIWITVITVIFIGIGILVWQYFGAPREGVKAPEEKISEEKNIKEEIVKVDEDLVFDKFGLSLFLPDNWRVEINNGTENFTAPYHTFSFSFIPPEEISSDSKFWGVLYIHIYKTQANIDKWIEKYLPDFKDYLLIEKREDIGGKPVFLLNLNREDKLWVPRYVILGSEYSYVYSFSQDGASDFIQRIIEEIFPNITIQ